MKEKAFRWCMLIGAASLAGVAVFYFANYVVLAIALGNSGVQPFLQDSIRAMWLTFGCQSLLIAALYALVAWKPYAVSRAVVLLLGMLQLVEAILLFRFAGSGVIALLLLATTACVLLGAVLWPKALARTEPAAARAVPEEPR